MKKQFSDLVQPIKTFEFSIRTIAASKSEFLQHFHASYIERTRSGSSRLKMSFVKRENGRGLLFNAFRDASTIPYPHICYCGSGVLAVANAFKSRSWSTLAEAMNGQNGTVFLR